MGQAVGMMATSMAKRCHDNTGQAECMTKPNYEEVLIVGRAAMDETKATEAGECPEDGRAEGGVEVEVCTKGVSNSGS